MTGCVESGKNFHGLRAEMVGFQKSDPCPTLTITAKISLIHLGIEPQCATLQTDAQPVCKLLRIHGRLKTAAAV